MGQNGKSTSSFPWKEILSFLGVVLVAYIGYLGIQSQIWIPIQTTQTAEARLTQSTYPTVLTVSTATVPNSTATAPSFPQSTETTLVPQTSAILPSSTSPSGSETSTQLPPRVRPLDNMVMLNVPGGTFQMGSGAANEAIHSVTLDPYWIDKTEVNNYQYKQCVAEQRCEPPKLHIGFDGDAQPVVGVTWDKAKQYCLWIGGDLPTEAQWEYAARGPQNYIYPWGNHFDYKWTNTKGEEDGYNGTAPVNSFEQGASWVGALNMAGNVYEWVNDWFDDDYYGYSTPLNPPGPAEGQLKVERGGDWYADPNLGTPEQIVQATKRAATDPHGDDNRVGFRCVVAINN